MKTREVFEGAQVLSYSFRPREGEVNENMLVLPGQEPPLEFPSP
jgi:hypothetical protein